MEFPEADRTLLIKFLGLLGSDEMGERASAGLKAHQLMRNRNLEWGDVVVKATARLSAPPPPSSWEKTWAERKPPPDLLLRENWLKRHWIRSRQGNSYTDVRGFRVVARKSGDLWKFSVVKIQAGFADTPYHDNRSFATEDEAKLQGFDAMVVWMKTEERN